MVLVFQLFYEVSVFLQVKDDWFICKLFNLFFHWQCIVDYYWRASFKFFLVCKSWITKHCFIIDICNIGLFEEVFIVMLLLIDFLFNKLNSLFRICFFVIFALQRYKSALFNNSVNFLFSWLVNAIEHFKIIKSIF